MQVIGMAGICDRFMVINYGPESALRVWYLFMLSKSVDCLPTYLDTRSLDQSETIARDRRRRARVQVHWPVCFIRTGTSDCVETVTHDLSSDGFYCLVNTAFLPGEIMECTLGVPMHHPNNRDRARPVRCRVRVIRVEALGEDGFYGVGCQIEDYRFIISGNGR